jgi:hypothetical protein
LGSRQAERTGVGVVYRRDSETCKHFTGVALSVL